MGLNSVLHTAPLPFPPALASCFPRLRRLEGGGKESLSNALPPFPPIHATAHTKLGEEKLHMFGKTGKRLSSVSLSFPFGTFCAVSKKSFLVLSFPLLLDPPSFARFPLSLFLLHLVRKFPRSCRSERTRCVLQIADVFRSPFGDLPSYPPVHAVIAQKGVSLGDGPSALPSAPTHSGDPRKKFGSRTLKGKEESYVGRSLPSSSIPS